MVRPLLALATRDNHVVRALVTTSSVALRRSAPWAHRLTALASTAFAATMRVIDRVHGNTTHRRTDTAPAHRTGLTDLTQAVFFVADFANGGAAVDVYATDFTGTQTHLGVNAFASQQDGRRTSRTGQLRALAGKHFDAVNGCTDGDVTDGQRIAGTDRTLFRSKQGCANLKTARSDDVATFTVGIANQCNVRSAVGVVFETLNLGRDAILVATEIDQAIVLLVTTATMAHGNVAIVVAARAAGFLFEQSCEWCALVQIRRYHLDHSAATSRGRLDFYECHLVHLCKVEFLTVFKRDISLALVTAATHETAKALLLALAVQDLNRLDLYFEQEFDGCLDFRLGGIGHNTKSDLLIFFGDKRGFFSDHGRQDNLH